MMAKAEAVSSMPMPILAGVEGSRFRLRIHDQNSTTSGVRVTTKKGFAAWKTSAGIFQLPKRGPVESRAQSVSVKPFW